MTRIILAASISTFLYIVTIFVGSFLAILEKRVPYSQRYLYNAIPDTNHNTNPTNPNRNSKGNPNPTSPTNPTNPNTRYRCEYGTRFSRIAKIHGYSSS